MAEALTLARTISGPLARDIQERLADLAEVSTVVP
jgi:hypothetical protein